MLRDVRPGDLPVFFEHQRDPDAARMADFPSRDRAAFDAHWRDHVLGNPRSTTQTIVVDGAVAGYVASWDQDGLRLVAYWVGRDHWGRGVATAALAAFLTREPTRPLDAY
ncbi:MAG TPA: GNAT family N-acetyltransferase, partial [Kofleriaceae bacterium]|nr:GNAT family N-acetyltransferase [Kofleriaceae bacterium]